VARTLGVARILIVGGILGVVETLGVGGIQIVGGILGVEGILAAVVTAGLTGAAGVTMGRALCSPCPGLDGCVASRRRAGLWTAGG
jgi:hypothetical protein